MRLYLSSFRIGNCPDRLVALARGERAAVVANAMDAAPPPVRDEGVQREVTALAELGFAADEFDLRAYSADPVAVASALEDYAVVWIRGGNTFDLRRAMAKSGADVALTTLIADDAFVYAGYSAGACVLAPSLRGLETVDPPGEAPIWDGLDVLPYAIVPHVESDHPESAALDEVAARYRNTGVAHRTLRDGEVLIIDGQDTTTCG